MSTPQSTADVKAKQSSKRKLNWSMLDDIQLTDSVRVHGFNWAHIATSLRNKTPTECRDRYEILVKNPRMTQLPSGLAGSSTQSTQVRMATRSTRQSPARSSQPALHSAPMQVQPPPVTAPPLPSDATLDFLFGASGDVFGPDISPVLDSSELESDVVTQKPDIPVATSEDSTQASRQKRRYACPHANCSSSYDIYQSYKYHVEQGCKLGTSSAIKSASAKGRPKSARSQRQALLWSEGGQVAQTPQAATPGPAADFAQFDFSSDLDEILNGTSSFDQFLLSSSQLGTTQPTIPDYQNTQHQFYNQQPMQRQYHPMMTRNAQYRFAPTDPNQRLQQPPFQQIGPSHQFLQHQQSAFPLSFTTGLSPSMGYNTRGSQRANQFSSSASSSPMHFAPLAAHPHFGHNPASFAPPSGRYQAPLREIAPKRVNTGISRGEVDSLFNEMFKTDGDKELVKEKEKEMESLLQCPLGVEPKWAWSSKEIFSVAQLSVLKIQMNNNFQLVAQAYVIERELHGAGAEETLHWEDQLKSLESLREWGVKGYGPTSYHNTTPIFKLDQIISLPAPTRRMPRSALSREFVRVMNYQLTETEYRERLQRSQKKNISAKNQVASSITTAPLFEGLTKLADIFRREWNRDLIPDILRVRRKKAEFLKMEDLLLIRGVISFGVNDIKGIRAHCLPGKTVDAIEGRIKSLRARSNEEKDNALKAMLLKPFKPVTILEKDIMRHGIQQRGASVFPQLLHLFPHHPVLIIEQLWMSMQMMGEVTIPVPSTSTNRLVEVDELSPVSVEDEEYSDDGIDDDDEAVEDDDSEEDQDDDDGSDENDVFALFDDAACDNDEEDTDDDDFDPNETNKGKGKEKPNSRETAEEMDEDSFLEDLLGRDVDGGDQQSEAVEPNIASHTVKKRKSVATRLPNAGSENGNDENSWSFRTKKDSKSRLRKLSLMDQTSSSTLGRVCAERKRPHQ
ncbi:hypothetical protein BDR26DRAFT_141826 [Obelidium mucronatum]|nr:hypothetical protein BDR26DRAFT_141826 [Obelidium mucronatum]